MKISSKDYEIKEELFTEELEWLKQEFEILFSYKNGIYTENDKKIANDIIDYIIEKT